MTSVASRSIRRFWKSIPLLKLTQGSSLSIRSNLSRPTNILIKSAWRDDGQLELTQQLSNADPDRFLCEVAVEQKEDQQTSLGRTAAHFEVLLQENRSHEAIHLFEEERFSHGIFNEKRANPTVDRFLLDDGTVLTEQPELVESYRRVDYSDGVAQLTSKEKENAGNPEVSLVLHVPEKINLNVSLSEGGGSINIEGKIEGDSLLSNANGDILVQKLRGHKIHLSGSGDIIAQDLLEAQNLEVSTCGRLRAKQIHSRSVRVFIDKTADKVDNMNEHIQDMDDEGSLVDISSLFISGDGGGVVSVKGSQYRPTKRAVRVKSHHGPLQVTVSGLGKPKERQTIHDDQLLYPLVELGGVNGSCQISTDETDVGGLAADDWISCRCHFDSLSEDSVSLLAIDQGSLHMTIDRKVEADLRLACLESNECLDEVGALLADEDDNILLEEVLSHLPYGPAGSVRDGRNSDQKLLIQTNSYTRQSLIDTSSLCYESGYVENKSNEPDSRYELKRHMTSGKIRIESAADQALQSFSSEAENTVDTNHAGRPLIAAVTTASQFVETLSWIGAIARRYGIDEGSRELGRTSGGYGRKLVSPTMKGS